MLSGIFKVIASFQNANGAPFLANSIRLAFGMKTVISMTS